MGKLIKLADWKAKISVKEFEFVAFDRSHHKPDHLIAENFDDRMTRIKTSLEKINKLMADVKKNNINDGADL